MRPLLILLAGLIVGSSAHAEVAECFSWKPDPGKTADMLQTMQEAAELHETLGATVGIYQINVGGSHFDYCMRWDNPIAWGESKDKMMVSQELTEWFASVKPTATMIDSISGGNVDPSVAADSMSGPFVFQVWVWEVAPKTRPQMMARFEESEAILEDLGARVEIYTEGAGGTGGAGHVHYVMQYPSWADMAKGFMAIGQSEKWAAFEADNDPDLGKVVQSFNGVALR